MRSFPAVLILILTLSLTACGPQNPTASDIPNQSETIQEDKVIDQIPASDTSKTQPMVTEPINDNVPKQTSQDTPGKYLIYTDSILPTLDGNIVLFFHAPWCPTCRGLDTNLNNSISEFPSNLNIVKVDYDSSAEMKKQYGVTYQHTLVQVDKDGNMINKWSGGSNLESIIKNLK